MTRERRVGPSEALVTRERRIGLLVFFAALAAIVVMLYPFGQLAGVDEVEPEVLDESLER